MMNEKINILADKIRDAKSIVIMGHKNPDGDALGAVLAMGRLIELNFGVLPVCVYDGNIPDTLDNFPLRQTVRYVGRLDPAKTFDLALVLDYGTVRNLGASADVAQKAAYRIEIDHHENDAPIGDLCINDVHAAATTQIIYEIMTTAGWKYDADVCNLVALGLMTDTGMFKYISDSRPLRIMADLVDGGIHVRRLADGLNNRPAKSVQAEATVVARAEFLYGGRLALATVMSREYKNLDGRGDMILGMLGQIKGVEYIAVLKQQRENQTGVSLRGRTRPVRQIATALGGGGHEYAAGAVIADRIDRARAQIIEMFEGE